MTKWKVGIVGAGMIADFHAKAVQDVPQASLVGFCDGGSGRARVLAEKYQANAFANDRELITSDHINLLMIASPSGNHLDATLLAAENGKHVLCEKPLEISTARIDQMIAAHEKSGTYLGGIFPYRFNDSLQPLLQAIENGRFGKITYGAVHVPWWRDDAYYGGNWRGTWTLDGGGAIMNQSIHMVDLLLLLMGPVDEVKAFGGTLGHDIETEDALVSALSFESGALGMIYGTTASFPGDFRRLELRGTEGTVIMVEDSFEKWSFKSETQEDDNIRALFGKISGGGGVSDPAAIPYINHTRNLQAFVDAIESGKPFAIDGLESRKAVELIGRMYQSAGLRP